MKIFSILTLLTAQHLFASSEFETRCGWFVNPSPANIFLLDADGNWTLSSQGDHFIEKEWDWPNFSEDEWIGKPNAYGHGCACITAKFDKEKFDVLEISKLWPQALKICLTDKKLSKWHWL